MKKAGLACNNKIVDKYALKKAQIETLSAENKRLQDEIAKLQVQAKLNAQAQLDTQAKLHAQAQLLAKSK